MRFILTIGQRLTISASGILGKALAIGLLLAVPTLGLTRLSSDLFASGQGQHEEATLADGSTEGLLAFASPAATLRDYQLRVRASSAANGKRDDSAQPSLLAKDWHFTAQPTNTEQINSFMGTLTRAEFLSDLALLKFGVPANVVNLVILQQISMNRLVNQNLATISQTTSLNVPMINAAIGNLVWKEFLFDAALLAGGVAPYSMSLILGQQLGFNEVITQFFLLAGQKPLVPASPS